MSDKPIVFSGNKVRYFGRTYTMSSSGKTDKNGVLIVTFKETRCSKLLTWIKKLWNR